MEMHALIETLRSRLSSWTAEPVPEHHRQRQQAAVLVLIRSGRDPRAVLTLRSAALTAHAGEVSFVGGKQDQSDRSLEATALRETQEELGVPGEALEIVSPLPGLVSKHGLWVTPFVALMNESTVLKPNSSEVSEVFEVPIAWLQDDPRMTTERLERQGEVQMAPVYEYRGYRIWGLTALILWDFIRIGLLAPSAAVGPVL